jgi:hypothetical protein
MAILRRALAIACVALVCLGASAAAKRLPPKPVNPVTSGGIRYSAAGDGRDEYVVAADGATGSVLWKVKVFHTHFMPWMEEDVQTIFINGLRLAGNAVLVRDEISRCYSVDLITKQVKRRQCEGVF